MASRLEEEIAIVLDDVEMCNRRLENAARRLNALMRDMEEERKKRKRERSPPHIVVVESDTAIYFSRVPIALGEDELRRFFAVHGRIMDFFFHKERRWGKVTYEHPEDQRNCLGQKKYYEQELQITIEPHKVKRTRHDR